MPTVQLAAVPARGSLSCRCKARGLVNFFHPKSPRTRSFTNKSSLLVGARPILRPQLPFLYPIARSKTSQTQIGRYISTEREQRWRENFWRYVRFNAYLWPATLLLTLMAFGVRHTKLERDQPTPHEWTFWSRWDMRAAAESLRASGTQIGHDGSEDVARASRIYGVLLERLESEKFDGKNLIKTQPARATFDLGGSQGLDTSAKSEQWRRGYHEALMSAARVAEHLHGMCIVKGEVRGKLYPKDSIPGPNNPRPKPLPWDSKRGRVDPPTLEEVEDAFPSPESFYLKIMSTRGFDTRQRLEAALALADWYDFEKMDDSAEAMYTRAAEIAQSGLTTGTVSATDVIDVKTGVILKGREDLVSDNILKTCTAFGVHHARNGNVKQALPVFLSVLKARKNLPPSPMPAREMGPTKLKAISDDTIWDYIDALTDLVVERPYPPPPPSGNERPSHTLKEACEEVGLMTYIGEILFATSESERAKGLSWTRDSVEAAEAIMWVMDEQREQAGRERCRECLETGLQNWKLMSQQMARLAAQNEQEARRGEGGSWLGLGLGKEQRIQEARTEKMRWEEENAQVELRRQKTLPLLQETLQPLSAGWLSTHV